jgi:hypothetical protein
MVFNERNQMNKQHIATLIFTLILLSPIVHYLMVDKGVVYTEDCRVMHQYGAPLVDYPSSVKVCTWGSADDLRMLLSSSTLPNVLVVAHGLDLLDRGWKLVGSGSQIDVEELPLHHDGMIGVYACRTSDTESDWTGDGIAPYEGHARVMAFTPYGHTLWGDALIGGRLMSEYLK